jgi:hypothetical protein
VLVQDDRQDHPEACNAGGSLDWLRPRISGLEVAAKTGHQGPGAQRDPGRKCACRAVTRTTPATRNAAILWCIIMQDMFEAVEVPVEMLDPISMRCWLSAKS